MGRDWVGTCVGLFKGAWESISRKPSGIHEWGGSPSPTLLFAAACCQEVDPTVTKDIVLRAYKDRENLGETYSPI